jgi:hypothetical protein
MEKKKRWNSISKWLCIVHLITALLPYGTFAQADSYFYKRKINKTDKEQFYSLVLTPTLTAHCKSGWNDIRIYNFSEKDTMEVPYVLECPKNKEEEKAVPFELINTVAEEGCCSYLTLKANKKQTINRIKLVIDDTGFDKWVKLEGSNDNRTWLTIKEKLRIVRYQNGNEYFEYTALDFPNAEYACYRLKFDDLESKRIRVTNAFAFETIESKGKYDELKINGWKQNENKKDKTSEIIVEFPASYRINYITVKSNSARDFYRNIDVYRYGGSSQTLKGDRDYWYTVNTSVFSSVGDNKISCYDQQLQKLKIVIVNNDNVPVEINEIRAFAGQCHLLAELPVSDSLYIMYGKADVRAPDYDLVHFKEKIPASIQEMGFGGEQMIVPAVKADNQLISNRKWLWAAMGTVMISIIFFSYIMIKKENQNGGQGF